MAKKITQVRGRKKLGKAGPWPGEPAAKAAKKADSPKTREKITHRVTTHKANGSPSESQEVAPEKVTIGEAMRRAVKELGDIIVDDTLAPAQMRELAEVYEDVAREQAAYNEKSEAAKLAKKSLESVTGLLLDRVRAFTHPTPLPLFDMKEAEEDHETMLEGMSGQNA